jgi:hypothetical protein
MDVQVASLDEEASRLLDSDAPWTLVARFERAVVIGRTTDDAMLSVVRNDVADGPYTVRLARSAPPDLRLLDRSPRLERSNAARWRAEPVADAEAVDGEELDRRLRVVDTIADRVGGPDRGYRAVIPASDLDRLEIAVARGDAGTAAAVAARIAGLGPGLTPSGDDVLAGLLAFRSWAEVAGRWPGGAPLRAAIREAAVPRTTRLAGQLLAAAEHGHVAAPLAGLLTSLLARSATFPPDLSGLLAIGATSGADLLGGVRLAGRACRRRATPAGGSPGGR